MKKIISLLLALVMIATLSVSVFAEEEKGSITINGVSSENVYSIYKLLDLESYNLESGAYSYKVNAEWTDFFTTDAAKVYFTIDDAGYITWAWIPSATDAVTEEEAAAEFSKIALDYAQKNNINPVKTSKNGDFAITGTTGVFSDLTLGYYLVDSTMGALCGLTTTNPNASIQAKNGAPTIDKQVKEDSTTQWGDSNSADIGQTVEFRTTINVHAGAQNYVLHDKMSAGLTFQSVGDVMHLVPGVKEEKLTEGVEYTVKVNTEADKCTFEVVFSQAFCDGLETNDKIIVHYSAMLNRDAVQANDNSAWLDFGDDHHTTKDTTTTYTYFIDIVKTDSQNKLINGAEFRIYDAATEGNEIKVVLTDDKTGYRRAREDEPGENIVVTNGKIRVYGFDNGTYYLEEKIAPEGYNKLNARQKFIISDGDLEATFNGETFSTGSGVHVVNKTGSMLPETGAEGTILFIVIGAIAVLGAGVLLVTKKRMSMIED